MGIFAWIILGAIAGLIAKALLPGEDPGGIVITTLIGIAGALIDEFFDISTWLGAIGGAALLLVLYRALFGARRTTRTI